MPNNDKGRIRGGNGSYLDPKKNKTDQLDAADEYVYPEPHVDDHNKDMEKFNKQFEPPVDKAG